jgi:DNA-binding MarR family transcriptional regulator
MMASLCVCAALRTAARKTTTIYDEALAEVGVNLPQFSLMRRIQRAAPVSLSDLARIAELDRSTVGRNVKVLQRMGLVRATLSEDHREATVSLEEEGVAVLREGAALWDGAQSAIEARLGAEGVAKLRALLDAL